MVDIIVMQTINLTGAFAFIVLITGPAIAAPLDGLAAFNKRFEQATRQMDNATLSGLWDEDGVTLVPDVPPIIGKAAISAFVKKAVAPFPHAHMKSFTLRCDGAIEQGLLASEWCFEHQVIDLGGGKSFDGRGRMLLVLRRGAEGRWRLLREMWEPAEASAH